jgi:beta-glucanase (GH16 family)
MNKFLIVLIFSQLSFGQLNKRKLVWAENFSGKVLNEKVWNIMLGDGCPNCGWGNNERQLYTNENHKLIKGYLEITAHKKGDKYTSSRLTTKDKKEFQYGYFEARAKLPIGQGVWPAFWMLGSNIDEVGWPKTGEIDILEYIGKEQSMVFSTLHTQDSYGISKNTKKTKIEGIENGFHTYGVDWSKNKMDFFVDDKLVYTFQPEVKDENTWPFDQPFYFLLNLAIGGSFGGPEVDDAIFPQKFVIDYIRVYQ